jgi:hypothetical protein
MGITFSSETVEVPKIFCGEQSINLNLTFIAYRRILRNINIIEVLNKQKLLLV